VRRLGAEETALLIRQIVGDRWRVHDGAAGSRPLRFGDVAVLIPTRTSLAALERALDDADVPYRLEGVSLVWAAQEVRDLLAILRASLTRGSRTPTAAGVKPRGRRRSAR